MMNIFSHDYQRDEVEFYGFDGEYTNGPLHIRTKEITFGRLDGYMYVDLIVEPLKFPVMFLDGALWMSLTPMEVQSQYVPINLAEGVVGLGGVGLGYALLAMMERDEVETVIAYEIDQRVIDFVTATFSDRDGFEKVQFVNTDVRSLRGMTFDFFYTDIYQTMLPNEVIDDIRDLRGNNDIGTYRFWGQEQVLVDGLTHGIIDTGFPEFTVPDRHLINDFATSEFNGLYRQRAEPDYVEQVLETLYEGAY